ncbi:MAG TPA: hypothetical protein P5545_06310, partial [Bacteroidota bacterium]|nr:hypothetical protein [Bacteroidota bacterium]
MKKLIFLLFFIAIQFTYAEWLYTGFGYNKLNIFTSEVQNDRIFQGTNMGLYASDNYGKTWRQIGFSGQNIITLNSDNTRIFTCCNKGICLST